MKLVSIGGEKIGLLVQLPTGPYAIDIVESLGVFAGRDPVSGALINGVFKERCAWLALVNNWTYLRQPLDLLARTALINPDDPRLALRSFRYGRRIEDPPRGILAVDITDAADLEIHDPTGRLVMARQFGAPSGEEPRQDLSSLPDNVHVVDFSHCKRPPNPQKEA